MGEESKAKQVFFKWEWMEDFELTDPVILWRVGLKSWNKRHGRKLAEIKRISEDRSDCWRRIEQSYRDARKGKRDLKKKNRQKKETQLHID